MPQIGMGFPHTTLRGLNLGSPPTSLPLGVGRIHLRKSLPILGTLREVADHTSPKGQLTPVIRQFTKGHS
jgi:hypothetical protein